MSERQRFPGFYGFYQGILTFERYKIKLYLAYKVINN